MTAAVFLAIGIPVLGGFDFQSAAMLDTVGEISRPIGIALLVIFVGYIALLIYKARKDKAAEDGIASMPIWKSLLLIVVGLACIIIGGQFAVDNAKAIAAEFGVSETLIGLTIVAVGTSLPELVTSIVASRKGENGLAVGNVVGSNLFNLLFILGVSGTIHPIAVNLASVIDLGILIVVSIIILVFSLTKKISRIEGAVMLALYAATVVFAVLR